MRSDRRIVRRTAVTATLVLSMGVATAGFLGADRALAEASGSSSVASAQGAQARGAGTQVADLLAQGLSDGVAGTSAQGGSSLVKELGAFADIPVPGAEGQGSGPGVPTTPVSVPSLFVNTQLDPTLTVPYGVDVPSWLNGRDSLFFRLVGEGDGRRQELLTAKDASALFEDGKGPLRLADGVAGYPVTSEETPVSASSILTWATPVDAGTTLSDGLGALDAVASLAAAPKAPADVAVAPAEVLGQLRVRGEQDDAPRELTVGAREGSTVVWLRSGDAAGTLSTTYGSLAEVASPLSSSYALNADGTFSQTGSDGSEVTPGQELSLSSLSDGSFDAYVKVPSDVRLQDGSVVFAGQVLRVPFALDQQAPAFSDASVLGPDGKPLDLSASWVRDGQLTVGASGIALSVCVSDPAPAEGSAPSEASSGIDSSSVRLTFADTGKELAATSVTDGVATFRLDAKALGSGTFDLSRAQVSVSDVAGNASSLPVTSFSPLSGDGGTPAVTELRIVDSSDSIWQSTVTLTAAGDKDDPTIDGNLTSNADEITLTADITDPLLSELLERDDWQSREALTYTIDGTQTAVAASDVHHVEGNTYSVSLPAVAAEGSHTVSVRYRGVSALFPFFDFLAKEDSQSFLIDRTLPVASDATLEGGIDKDQVADLGDQGKVLLGKAQSVRFAAADAAAEGVDVSGLASVSATAQVRDALDAVPTKLDLGALEAGENGSFGLTLAQDGCYALSDIVLTITDRAGNQATVSLVDVVGAQAGAGAWGIDALLVDTGAQASDSVGFDVTPVEGTPTWGDFYPADVSVGLSVRDHWFWARSHTPAFARSVEGTLRSASGVSSLPADAAASGFEPTGEKDVWRLELPFARTDGKLADGRYEASFSYGSWTHRSVTFGVDTLAPQLTDASVSGAERDPVAEMPDDASVAAGQRVLSGSSRSVRLRVRDLLPRSGPEAAPEDVRDEEFASGVDATKVTATLSRAVNATMVEKAPSETVELSVDDEGWATLDLAEEGLYELSDIRVSASDNYGNVASETLAEYVASLPEEERAAWDFDAVLVDRAQSLGVSVSLSDDEGTPASKDPYYHRGSLTAAFEVTDPWLPVYEALFGLDDIVTGTLRAVGADVAEPLGATLSAGDFSLVEGTADTWRATLPLPSVSDGADALPIEGDYELEASYAGVAGRGAGAEPKQATAAFGVDYTAPKLGGLTFSQTEPLPVYEAGEHRDEPWGWIFAREAEEGSLVVTDNLAGVAGDTLSLATEGTADVTSAYEEGASPRSGTIAFSFGEDAERLFLAGTSAAIEDVAGNRADSGPLASYAFSNLPQGATNVAIDTVAPEVGVAFDNNDVRNERYYNRARTATVTVTESNFDLLREYAPDTVIATTYRDGSDYADTTLAAKDFEAATLEDGSVVWRAGVTFEDDADWELKASFTDAAGRTSNEVDTSFVIDTQAPSVMVEYDNDDVANAMYYKAPRTATITVDDRNFSPDFAAIDARSFTGGAAPGVSGWSETEPRAEWKASASFAGETHYQLGVEVTDLAGNVAEPYDSGEFVIDLTAPQVSISGVEDRHAYANTADPDIDYADTNLDALMSEYTVTGARQGETYFENASEADTDTEKHVDLGDAPYEVGRDDVYTLSAKAVDLAGNTSETQLTYSVNRFGSTYYFGQGSEGVQGSYLTSPQDVQVVEVNVSGLDTSRGRAELAQDDASRQLEAGSDYVVDANAPDAGWSATTYTFPASLFSEDGYYCVTVTSTDEAGSLSQNTMDGKGADRQGSFPVSFAVDQTAPTASLVGLDSGGVYLDPEKSALVDGRDNLELTRLSVQIDGTEVSSWEADALASSGPLRISLPADGRAHSYCVEATDRAGHVASATYDDVLVTGDWVTYVLNTPRLLMLMVGGVVVLLGAAGALTYLGVRRHRAHERERNPFGH